MSAAVLAALTGLLTQVFQSGADRTTKIPEAESEPFTWTLRYNDDESRPCRGWIFGKQPSEIPVVPPEGLTEAWARSHGGVDAGHTSITVTLQGGSEKAVVLQAMRARVSARKPPLAGSELVSGWGCGGGGGAAPGYFDVDLDAEPPSIVGIPGSREEEAPGSPGSSHIVEVPAAIFPYSISQSEADVFVVDGTTRASDVTWELEIDWVSEGRSGTIRIPGDGAPFRTTASSYGTIYYIENGRWTQWGTGSTAPPPL